MKSFHQKKTRSFRLFIYNLHFSDLKTWVPLGVWLQNHQALAPNTSSDFPQSPLQGLMRRQRCHKKNMFTTGKLFPASCFYCTRQLMPSQVVYNMFFNGFEFIIECIPFIIEFIPRGEPVCRQRASYCHIRIIPAMQLAQLDLKSAFSRNNLAINLQIPLPVIVL